VNAAGLTPSRTIGDTEGAGRDFANSLRAGDVVLLEGDLAAGKTTLVRGLVAGLGGDARLVSSPSFTLVNSYDCSSGDIGVVHHVDLYRLAEDVNDLREIGLDELLSDPAAIVAVEWPKDTLATWIPADARTWRVVITTGDDDSRIVEITPPSELRN
jgi:tRNA threonylcarbamoyl adenosine modification protein YjeE